MAIQTEWTEDDMVALDWRDFVDAVSRAMASIKQVLEGMCQIVGDWAKTLELERSQPTPHDFAAARVQLRREGVWQRGDPAPVAAIEERARLLALMAWARNRGAR